MSRSSQQSQRGRDPPPQRRQTNAGNTNTTTTSSSNNNNDTEIVPQKLANDAFVAISALVGAVLVLRALAASLAAYGFLLPILYLYGLGTRPAFSSFDAKRELQSVLRGDHDGGSNKDNVSGNSTASDNSTANNNKELKGMFARFLAEGKAMVASELLMLPGYEKQTTDVAGAAYVTTLFLPTVDKEYTWIGCNHHWYYWGSRERRISSSLSSPRGGGGTAAATQQQQQAPAFRFPESANFSIGKTNVKLEFAKQD
mmetsp:Transcript_25818/g.55224  ORF Transcript_25818/g.55224 Transcript_25818/m.55224 type:complete len:256 (+) Transcript_25818:1430-2197(+)